jgi:hypothetical protein
MEHATSREVNEPGAQTERLGVVVPMMDCAGRSRNGGVLAPRY